MIDSIARVFEYGHKKLVGDKFLKFKFFIGLNSLLRSGKSFSIGSLIKDSIPALGAAIQATKSITKEALWHIRTII